VTSQLLDQEAASDRRSPYQCDGRTHCSEMTSCAEAEFFLANCPGVKMDGGGDGVPCERLRYGERWGLVGQHCKQALKFDQELALTGVEKRPGLKRHLSMRIVSLSPFHMVNIGLRMLVNPRRGFTPW